MVSRVDCAREKARRDEGVMQSATGERGASERGLGAPRPPRPHHVAWAVADFYARHCAGRPLDDVVLALMMHRHLPGSQVVDGLAVSPEASRPYAWVRHEGQDYDPARLARRIRGREHALVEYRLERRAEGLGSSEAAAARRQQFADAAAILEAPDVAAFVMPTCPSCRGQSHAHTYDEGCQSLWAFSSLLARAGGRRCSCSPWGTLSGPYDPAGHPRQRLHWQCEACRRSLLERARWGLGSDDWGRAVALSKLHRALRSGELESFCVGV